MDHSQSECLRRYSGYESFEYIENMLVETCPNEVAQCIFYGYFGSL